MSDGGTGPDAVYRVEVRVVAPVHPTEVTDRVEDAIENLFPDATIERETDRVVGTARSVERFAELLRRQEILDTARERLLDGRRETPRASERTAERSGEAIHVELKKLAAYQGVVNFAVGTPDELGELEVRIRVEEPDVETFVDSVAPPTTDGEPAPS